MAAITIVFLGVLAALIEEWMCRGVLWVALRRIADDRTAIFSTAILFTMLHGLGEGQVFELPSRFLLGLALGWLRARTGSLVPCIAAHFTNNAAVCRFLWAGSGW